MFNTAIIKEVAMSSKEKKTKKEQEEIFEKFKNVEITPIPHFLTELLELPKEQMDFLRKIADEHNCTTSYVIAHFLGDLVTETKDISELTEEVMVKASKDKAYMFIKKDGKPFARISFFHEEDYIRRRETETD